MSKHKKRKNHNYQQNSTATNNPALINEYSEEYEDDDELECDDDVLEDSEIIDQEVLTETEPVVEIPDNSDTHSVDNGTCEENNEEIQHVNKPLVSINLYRVGSNFVQNKCINQIISTTDLEIAKNECINARDTHKKTYYVFDEKGNALFTSEYRVPKDNYYRVGTEWKNGRCINQKYFTINLDDACKNANDNTKSTGMIHNVYSPSGKLVFSSKKKLTLLSYKKREVNKNADWYIK